MTFSDFIQTWNGRYCEVAGSPGAENQCVDLANAYLRDVLNHPIVEWTNARDFPSKLPDFDWIQNTPDGVPQEGDIIVWQNSTVGHIAIFLEGTASTFKSFDQNWPTGSPCHVQSHTYVPAMCWGRPKTISPTVGDTTDYQTIIDQLRAERDTNWNLYISSQETIKVKDARILDLEGQVNTLTNEKSKLVEDIATIKNQLLQTTTLMEKDHEDDLNMVEQLMDATAKVATLEKQANDYRFELGLNYESTPEQIIEKIKSYTTIENDYQKSLDKLMEILDTFWNNLIKNKKAKSLWQKIKEIL